MKLNPEQHGKGREAETQARRSSFARARTQLSQAVGDVLAGRLESKRQGGWLNAFGALAPASTHAERLREVVIRDRALAAANPRPRRTLREEEEAARTEAPVPSGVDDAPHEVSASAEAVAAEAVAAEAVAAMEPVEAVREDDDDDLTRAFDASMLPVAPVVPDDAVRALAAALDAAQSEERTPDEPAEATPLEAAVAEAAEVAAAERAAPEVALAEATSAPTPLEEIAAKATKVRSKSPRESAKPKREPIRTRTMARLLASQGHRTRALSIYDELLAADASDASLRDEAEAVRAQAE